MLFGESAETPAVGGSVDAEALMVAGYDDGGEGRGEKSKEGERGDPDMRLKLINGGLGGMRRQCG